MQGIINFFDHPFFIIIWGITTTILVAGLIYKIISWFFGITPVIFRLGIALWKREIAVFSSLEVFDSLKSTLIDSWIFKEKNIIHIKRENIDKSKSKTLFLVDWETFWNEIEVIFNARKDSQTAVVIYAKPASIPQDKMTDIANRTNTIVVNFRGRLLNDILNSLITTSYDR
ncbi:MAG: hypothetical protein ACD_71C00032G0004 [uncultured bacterium (gcode 4)]|uniref:Uncharacterized protein n=1 Tax=uncultured bacterium (gcode 4) TaxID=1234023 RepID=K1Z682_9BACT|nr:MAG: hypothetical protein ACD_71C00032G0004 [uncultured bacterium (gcode 4)]